MSTYLLEIGLEEMPAREILPAIQGLKTLIQQTLETQNITPSHYFEFSSPRRLAIQLEGLPEKQPDQTLTIKGPPLELAQNQDGSWTKAAIGFAKKQAVEVSSLIRQEVNGRKFIFATKEIIGQSTKHLLQEHLPQWITQVPFSKKMRWGKYQLRYTRPMHWIVSLWNDEIIPCTIESIEADRFTYGHRFLTSGKITLPHASQYATLLRKGFVEPQYEQRKEMIISQMQVLEHRQKMTVSIDPELLQEVTNLVEYPTALVGFFEEEFLTLPREVLVTTMAVHQRYFPTYQNQTLTNQFITVRNGNDQHLENVQKGNQKVIRARLSDARFFYEEDQKKTIDYFIEKSQRVVFFEQRGTLFQRVERIVRLSKWIADQMQLSPTSQQRTIRIAELCKFDLCTQMVYEFPELQGVMGRYYATHFEEEEAVAKGIGEHYYPRNAQDHLPSSLEALCVALADRMDLLTVAFSLGLIPSGSADKYALRRAAQGIIQILFEKSIPLGLEQFIQTAIHHVQEQQEIDLTSTLAQSLLHFFELRMRYLMQEKGIRHDVIVAVVASPALPPATRFELAKAISQRMEQPSFKSVVEAVVRAINIYEKQGKSLDLQFHAQELQFVEETELWKALEQRCQFDLEIERFLQYLEELEPQITQFFDHLMIMDENPIYRMNRLWICKSIAEWSLHYADLREIVFVRED